MTFLLKNAEAVYRYYHEEFGDDGDGDPHAVGLFAYALVEKEKFEWIEHHREQNEGREPTAEEIDRWYVDKPRSYFVEKSSSATRWYKAFAWLLLEDDIEGAKQEVVRSGIVETVGRMKGETIAEITKLTGVKAFAINVGAGIVAAIVVSALALLLYSYHEASNPDLVEQLRTMMKSQPSLSNSIPVPQHP